jgi:hypothetical protein
VACSGAAYRAVPTTAPAGSVQLPSASAREAEVGDPYDPVLVEEEVGRLDVAVHEAARVLECRDLAPDVRGLRGRHRAPASSRLRKLPPCSSSSTMKGTSSSPQSYTAMMLGWCNDAATCARRESGGGTGRRRAACNTFTATRRRSRTSSAT